MFDDLWDGIGVGSDDLASHIANGGDPHAAAEYLTQAALDIHINDASDPHAAADYLEESGGTMTGVLVLSADPINALDAATMQYVDAATGTYTDADARAAVDNGTYLKLAGGTMEGDIDMDGNTLFGTGDLFFESDCGGIVFTVGGVNLMGVEGDHIVMNRYLDMNFQDIDNPSAINVKTSLAWSLRMQNVAGDGGFALTKSSDTLLQIWSYTDGFACMEINASTKKITATNGYSFV